MVTFNTIKFKHYKAADALLKSKLENAQPGDPVDIDPEEVVKYAVGLVAEWDFVDPDTGKPLPVSEDSIDELTLEQFKELFREFTAKTGHNIKLLGDVAPAQNAPDGVKKTNGATLTSSSTKSKTAKKPS